MNKKQMSQNAKTVNRYLGSRVQGDPDELYRAARHLIVHGGKRLRPYLVLKSSQMLGGKKSDAMPAAASVEMVHNFTLVHDDIMDNDEMRHGVPTVHQKFGMPVAILAGDVLFSKAFATISNSRLSPSVSAKLFQRLSQACVDVCEGQIYDIGMAQSKKIPTRTQYIKMIQKKTAALFCVSCAMGAICAGASERDIKNLSAFGNNLGIAFQITDDLIGVMGDPKVTKKPVGNDLREGKKSLPILLALERSRGQDKKRILQSFGNAKATKKNLASAVDTIKSLGIEDETRKTAIRYATAAQKSLSKYSGSTKDELVNLLSFVTSRSV